VIDSILSEANLHGQVGYRVPVEIRLRSALREPRPTKKNSSNRGQLAEIDPTSFSTTLPWDMWLEFKGLLEFFGSIDDKGEYVELYDYHSDPFAFTLFPSLEIAIQLSDGNSHFVLPFSYKDFLAPTTTGSRFRLLVTGQETIGEYCRLGNNILNKFAILFDAKNRRIAFGKSKNYINEFD